MSADLDMSEVRALGAALGRQERVVRATGRAVAQAAGMRIGRRMQAEARHVQAGRVSSTITYDVKEGANSTTVEVGPARHTAGGLAFFYYGNSKIGPRITDPIGALRDEAEVAARKWAQGVGDAL